MIVLSSDDFKWNIVLIFGLGLIGINIFISLKQKAGFSIYELPYSWIEKSDRKNHTKAIVTYLANQIEKFRKFGYSINDGQISFLWCAGRGGFGMTEAELESEMKTFQDVVALAEETQILFPNPHYAFHMLSSAGGLFEGQCEVEHDTIPNPIRPYGLLKLKQEYYLCGRNTDMANFIYRPSSVYGFAGVGRRLGLIPTLIQNAFKYKVSNIYGGMHTLRDYVLASDIGHFVADNILNYSFKSQSYILVSGKPSTISEIVRKIELIVNRKLYVHYEASNANSASNSYRIEVFPQSWAPTDIQTGIRRTYFELIGRA